MVKRIDIAKIAQVSTTTVTRVINNNGYVSAEVRKRVTDAIRKMDYIPNNIAKSLSKNRSNIIAVLIDDLDNQYFLQTFEAMVEEAKKEGVIVSLFKIKSEDQDEVLKILIAERILGAIDLTVTGFYDAKYFEILKKNMIRFVRSEDCVFINYESGIREMFAALKKCGRKKLAFIAALPKERAERDGRLGLYKKYVREYGFSDAENLVLFGNYPKEKGADVGSELGLKLIRSGVEFDSVFCLNDSVAAGVLKVLHMSGIKVPEDAALIGCDNTLMSEYLYPSLSSIDIGKAEQGCVYFRKIIAQQDSPKMVIDVRFVQRDSLG